MLGENVKMGTLNVKIIYIDLYCVSFQSRFFRKQKMHVEINFFIVGTLQDKPPCPRKRGLSEGLTKAENKILNRPLYKLNVKKAAKGYFPETEYRRKYTLVHKILSLPSEIP